MLQNDFIRQNDFLVKLDEMLNIIKIGGFYTLRQTTHFLIYIISLAQKWNIQNEFKRFLRDETQQEHIKLIMKSAHKDQVYGIPKQTLQQYLQIKQNQNILIKSLKLGDSVLLIYTFYQKQRKERVQNNIEIQVLSNMKPQSSTPISQLERGIVIGLKISSTTNLNVQKILEENKISISLQSISRIWSQNQQEY
ncbi:hypothetical protein ABPG72_020101 [Tetrahymena utriculariae]